MNDYEITTLITQVTRIADALERAYPIPEKELPGEDMTVKQLNTALQQLLQSLSPGQRYDTAVAFGKTYNVLVKTLPFDGSDHFSSGFSVEGRL